MSLHENQSLNVIMASYSVGRRPYGFHLPQEATAEEIRQRRLWRFDN